MKRDYYLSFTALLLGMIIGGATVAYAVRHQPKIVEHEATVEYRCSSNEWVVKKPKIRKIKTL